MALSTNLHHPRVLPVIVLADVSGSMAEHAKIETLNLALREMLTGHGLLLYGRLRPARLALRPWYRHRDLRRLARPRTRPSTATALPS